MLELQAEIRGQLPVFHWMLEFPEVFYAERPDPLEGGRANRAACMDAFIGNPPFGGKNEIADFGGPGYIDWLKTVHEGAHGNADYSAHFFRRADCLLGRHGTIGLIATKTIAQGDTRSTGLQRLVDDGLMIYDAIRLLRWPGAANVTVAVIHLAKGRVTDSVSTLYLNGIKVEAINSRLRSKPERPDPERLMANTGLCFQGSIVLGMGFTLAPEERDALVGNDPRNAERIFPYIGGDETNSNSLQDFERYVINFEAMTLEEAEQWPDLLAIVRERVKPGRDSDNRPPYRTYWWQFAEKRVGLYEALATIERCLVLSRHSKHFCLSFQPTGRVFSEATNIFAVNDFTQFATLQSRVHEFWARLLSSSLEERLRYSVSDCFETFPFPQRDAREILPELESIGLELYESRARFMRETQQGLTDTYNLLKDPACRDPQIEELRRLHEELDSAVIAAYGWTGIEVPPYRDPINEAERRALEAFEDEVIDRLFLLNAQRAEEERREALSLEQREGRGRKGGRGRGKKGGSQMSLEGVGEGE